MLSLKERIDLLEEDLKSKPPAFVMSASLPFAIFRYDPWLPDEREWRVRDEIRKLVARVQNNAGHRVAVVSLASLFWKSIQESEGLDALVQFERKYGFAAAQQQVHQYLSDPDFRPLKDLILEEVHRRPECPTVIFLVHATVFAPGAYRISSLLEQLSGQLRTPAVLFYPGTWVKGLNYMGLRTDDQALGSYRVKIYGRGQ